ncbi:hypothetical protein GWI24_23410 [Streptomyces sp. MK37H]|nr:hypothetical protein [Streptomyces sp. MK37H]
MRGVHIDIVGADRATTAKEPFFVSSIKWLERSPFVSLPRTSSMQVRQHGDIRGGGCRGGRVVVCRGGLTCPDR